MYVTRLIFQRLLLSHVSCNNFSDHRSGRNRDVVARFVLWRLYAFGNGSDGTKRNQLFFGPGSQFFTVSCPAHTGLENPFRILPCAIMLPAGEQGVEKVLDVFDAGITLR
jgi:hypothetical protein